MNPFFNPHLRMYLLILERKEERVRERETHVREKHQLPPVCPSTGDQTHNLFGVLDKMMIPPTEPPSQYS